MRRWLVLWLLATTMAAWARPAPIFLRFTVDPADARITLSQGAATKDGRVGEKISFQFYDLGGSATVEIRADHYLPYKASVSEEQVKSWSQEEGAYVSPLIRLEPTAAGFLLVHKGWAAAVAACILAVFAGIPRFLEIYRRRQALHSLSQRKKELMLGVDLAKDPLLGNIVGPWYLADRLGMGGMAAVYRAVPADSMDKTRAVALKIIRMDRDSTDARERFQREAMITTRLNHPNVVRLFEIGGEADFDYFVMELVEGKPLKVPKGGMGLARLRPIAEGVFEGLCYAHSLGIVHRDLKPENIMITTEGNVKLMDFGLARTRNLPTLTGSSIIVGTPAYIPPELIMGQHHRGSIDFRTDQYSLGVTLYELLTGRRPFEHEDPFQLVSAHLSQAPAPPTDHRPDLPAAINAVILRLLEKQPQDRFPTMNEAYQAWKSAVS